MVHLVPRATLAIKQVLRSRRGLGSATYSLCDLG